MDSVLSHLLWQGGEGGPDNPPNPRISQYHKEGSGITADDRTPWCASFCNFVVRDGGAKGSGGANAGSFGKSENFVELDAPAVGAIAVVRNGAHATIVVGLDSTKQGNFVGLGGNQGGYSQGQGMVKYSSYPVSAEAGTRYFYPVGMTPSPDGLPAVNPRSLNTSIPK